MQRHSKFALVGFSFLAASQAQAAGFALNEQGVSGLGNAYAGAAAVAEDATTVWWNPAGMSRLAPGKHIVFAGAVIAPSTKFKNNGSVPAALQTNVGGEGGDASDTAFLPSGFFAMDLSPRLNFGLGVNVPFGLATEYDSSWIGRFQGVKSEVETVNINPAISYKLSDNASIGGGISYQHGKIDLTTGVNYSAAAGGLLGPNLEGQNTTSVDGDAWGFNVGAIVNVGRATRLGVHYRSSLSYDLDGNTSFSNRPAPLAANPLVADGSVKMSLKTPDSTAFSVVHDLNDRMQLLGDATWTKWSRIDQVPVVRSTGATLDTLNFGFRDTWRLSAGTNYRLSGTTLLKAGIAYDQTPVPSVEKRSVRLPDSDRWWLSLGAAFLLSPHGKLDVGYTFVKAKDASIHNDQQAAGRGLIQGTYEATVHVFGVQYQHTF
jgi:long-chain fatty acid transport protein